jgi:cytochrome c553
MALAQPDLSEAAADAAGAKGAAGRLCVKRGGFALALLLAACGRSPQAATPAAPAPHFARAAGQTQLQHGERLASVLGCKGCHGQNLQGQPWEEQADLAISFSSNLTRALPGYSDAALERAIRQGVRADGSPLWGMPSEIFTELDPADMAALIAWLRTTRPAGVIHPRIVFGPRGRREVAAGTYRSTPEEVRASRGQGPARFDAAHDLARYMLRATCGECHGVTLTGNTWPAPERSPPDLNIAGAYPREDFRRLLRTGVATGGRQVGLLREVARGRFAHLTDAEVDAIYDYLAARARR